ncbi:MAG: PorT family protein [Bacteroidales bacterium]|nr:PorT family protein [Bacteroidales bacterium]
MKKISRNIVRILFVFATLMSCNVQAQLFKANVSAGFTIAQIDGDELYGFKHVGFTGGVGVMMPVVADKTDEGFQLSTEILLTQRGAKNSYVLDPFAYKCNLTYIDIPFMIHYVDKRAGATLGVGLQYGRLISTKEIWTLADTMINGMDRPVDITNHDFKKNDLSFVADFRFTVWRNFKFDVRWQYSLLPIRKDVEFFNSYNPDDDLYRSWKRDYKSQYVSFKLIYVINEEHNDYRTKPNRRKGAY